jgi:uncharacterized protein (DUF4415 family)
MARLNLLGRYSRESSGKNWLMKNAKSNRESQSRLSKGKTPGRRRASQRRQRKAQGLSGLTQENLQRMKIGELYRPLKKPVTLRLDADVLAWFKKDGKRYQTRINQALRSLMEREMKAAK